METRLISLALVIVLFFSLVPAVHAEEWTEHEISESRYTHRYFAHLVICNIDGANFSDVVVASYESNSTYWAPDNPKTNWPPENKHTISSTIYGPLGVYVYDMDGDGDPDVVAAAEVGNYTVWYERPADPKTGAWNGYTIGSNLNGSVDVGVAYIDSDLHPDVVVTAHEADKVVWYKAPEDPKTTWPPNAEHIIASDLDDARGLKIADVDGWGILDVVVAASGNSTTWEGGKVVWYQGPEDPAEPGATWTPTTIGELNGAYDVDVGNIDGDEDGSPDVVASSGFHYGWPDRLVWYDSSWPVWPIPEVPFGIVLLLGTSLLVLVTIAAARRLRLNQHVRK